MNQVTVTISGPTGSGKSAIAGEIEIMCKALGLHVEWAEGQAEKNLTHADWTSALEMYKPIVRIVEAAAAAPVPAAPSGWKVVPVEPTPKMAKAAADAWLDSGSKLYLNKAHAAVAAGIKAAPAAASFVHQTPLTVGQIGDLWTYRKDIHGGDLMPQLYDLARAIEAAHGIVNPTPAALDPTPLPGVSK